jgi:hypothetical protein
MSELDEKRIFYINSMSWIEPALMALTVALLSFVLKYHFFYLHYYLLVASVVCFLLAYRKYAILDEQSLTILFGIDAPGIIIDFDQIETIKYETKKINGIFRIGGKFGGVPNCTKQIDYILISLRTPLRRQYFPHDTNKREMNIEDKKMEIADDGLRIILYKPPKGGFRSFLDTFPKSVKVLNADIFDYENKYANFAFGLLNWLMSSVGITLVLYIWYKTLK